MANDPLMSQDEIERLFSQSNNLTGAGAKEAAVAPHQTAVSDPEPQTLAQDDIEKLLAGNAPTATATAARPQPAMPSAPVATADQGIAQSDIDFLLAQAERALDSVNSPQSPDRLGGASLYRLEEFGPGSVSSEAATFELIRDVELDLKIELGRTHMYLEDVLKLRKGSVVPLDKLAGDPVDVYVNGRLIARGEVLVLNDNYCVRVAELVEGAKVGA